MKTITVVGSTSDIGEIICENLTGKGHQVRGVSRKEGVSLDDYDRLKKAFKGSDSAYLMIPFDMAAPDLHQREREISNNILKALSGSGIQRIVLLSGLNAHLKIGSGLGAAIMEETLQHYPAPEMVFLRCGFFMENFLKGLSFLAQAQSGIFQTAFRGDVPMPIIASADIARIATDILLEENFVEPRVRELHGGGWYSFEQATEIFSEALHPGTIYRQCSYEDAFNNMKAAGVSESFAHAVIETAESFNRLDRWALETPSVLNTTPTTLEIFASEWAHKRMRQTLS